MGKGYNFKAKILNTCKGYVEAESWKDAVEKIINDEYEEIYDEYDGTIVKILDVEEV